MAADFVSTQLTAIDAGGASAHLAAGNYILGTMERPIYHGRLDFDTGVLAKSKTAAMVRLPIGIIPMKVGILLSESSGSAKFSIGISGAGAKYRALATQTDATGIIYYQLESAYDDGALTAIEEIWITNDATADFPTTSGGGVDLFFECLWP